MTGAAALVAALVLAAAALGATAPSSYSDPEGDVAGGIDVSSVAIGNNIDGPVVLSVQVSALPDRSDVTFAVLFDTDQNARTGSPDGWEYMFASAPDGWDFMKWNGNDFESAGDGVVFFPTLGADTPVTLTIPQSDIGSPKSFDFAVFSFKGADLDTAVVDRAPDQGIWTYKVATPPVIESMTVITSGKAKAGASFGASGAALKLAGGGAVKAEFVTCSITLNGKHVGGSACWITLPKTARGKTLALTVTATYEGAKAVRTTKVKVR